MKTVIIEYAVIDPVTLINKIEKAFPGAMARFTDIDEDYFELSVWGCIDLEMLEVVLAEYVQKGSEKNEKSSEVKPHKLGNCGNALAKGHAHQGGIAMRPSVL